MARTPRWRNIHFKNNVLYISLSHWKYFSDYINQEMLEYTAYIYRGHGEADWLLEPTIDRIIKTPTSPRRAKHLHKFKLETRGRRGRNPAKLEHENDWWALGQHHGLHTPLLDWTESPFVSLYFAAADALSRKSRRMAVFALSQGSVEYRNTQIRLDDSVKEINDRKPTVRLVRPISDENSRLVIQRGLFIRGPNNVDLEDWVRIYPGRQENSICLLKIFIPTKDIRNCLKYLNRMNINHSTLFPDLLGASEHANNHLEIKDYG